MAMFIPTYHNPGTSMDISKKHWRFVAEYKGAWLWESWIPKGGDA